jgi:dipeptidyl aminopeptidase/acylaminoacyl peptidase
MKPIRLIIVVLLVAMAVVPMAALAQQTIFLPIVPQESGPGMPTPTTTQPAPTATGQPPTQEPTITPTTEPTATPTSDLGPGQIAYFVSDGVNYQMQLIDPESAKVTPLLAVAPADAAAFSLAPPSWCPTTPLIAFASNLNLAGTTGDDWDIYVIGADGTGLRALTDAPGDDVHPAWSHDCTRVAFASNRDGNFEIYLMNADGSNQQRLTVMDADDRWPRWSPDDRYLLFEQGTT